MVLNVREAQDSPATVSPTDVYFNAREAAQDEQSPLHRFTKADRAFVLQARRTEGTLSDQEVDLVTLLDRQQTGTPVSRAVLKNESIQEHALRLTVEDLAVLQNLRMLLSNGTIVRLDAHSLAEGDAVIFFADDLGESDADRALRNTILLRSAISDLLLRASLP